MPGRSKSKKQSRKKQPQPKQSSQERCSKGRSRETRPNRAEPRKKTKAIESRETQSPPGTKKKKNSKKKRGDEIVNLAIASSAIDDVLAQAPPCDISADKPDGVPDSAVEAFPPSSHEPVLPESQAESEGIESEKIEATPAEDYAAPSSIPLSAIEPSFVQAGSMRAAEIQATSNEIAPTRASGDTSVLSSALTETGEAQKLLPLAEIREDALFADGHFENLTTVEPPYHTAEFGQTMERTETAATLPLYQDASSAEMSNGPTEELAELGTAGEHSAPAMPTEIEMTPESLPAPVSASPSAVISDSLPDRIPAPTPLLPSRAADDGIPRPVKILLVEDGSFLRRRIERALVRAGYDVVTAADGEAGIEAARREQPDLILLDLLLPKIGGQDVLKTLKKDPATEKIAVVVLSALSQMNAERLQADGALAFLEKSELGLDKGPETLLRKLKAIAQEVQRGRSRGQAAGR